MAESLFPNKIAITLTAVIALPLCPIGAASVSKMTAAFLSIESVIGYIAVRLASRYSFIRDKILRFHTVGIWKSILFNLLPVCSG